MRTASTQWPKHTTWVSTCHAESQCVPVYLHLCRLYVVSKAASATVQYQRPRPPQQCIVHLRHKTQLQSPHSRDTPATTHPMLITSNHNTPSFQSTCHISQWHLLAVSSINYWSLVAMKANIWGGRLSGRRIIGWTGDHILEVGRIGLPCSSSIRLCTGEFSSGA